MKLTETWHHAMLEQTPENIDRVWVLLLSVGTPGHVGPYITVHACTAPTQLNHA
jgi:hypothetical protein